jgi:hypothetical protein
MSTATAPCHQAGHSAQVNRPICYPADYGTYTTTAKSLALSSENQYLHEGTQATTLAAPTRYSSSLPSARPATRNHRFQTAPSHAYKYACAPSFRPRPSLRPWRKDPLHLFTPAHLVYTRAIFTTRGGSSPVPARLPSRACVAAPRPFHACAARRRLTGHTSWTVQTNEAVVAVGCLKETLLGALRGVGVFREVRTGGCVMVGVGGSTYRAGGRRGRGCWSIAAASACFVGGIKTGTAQSRVFIPSSHSFILHSFIYSFIRSFIHSFLGPHSTALRYSHTFFTNTHHPSTTNQPTTKPSP